MDIEKMNAEYDRKESLEHIKGEYNLHRNKEMNDGDNNDNGVPDGAEIFDRLSTREQLMQNDMHKSADVKLKREEMALKQKESQEKTKQEYMKRKLDMTKHNGEMRERALDRKNKMEVEKLKARTAIRNKTSGEK